MAYMGIINKHDTALNPSQLIGKRYRTPSYAVPRAPGEIELERQQSKYRVKYIAVHVIGKEDDRWRYDARRSKMVPKDKKKPRG